MRALALLLALAGCGPQLAPLLEGRHYREAICAAHDGSAEARAQTGRALDADAELRAHLRVASADELRAALGDAAEAVRARGHIARVTAQTNVLPVDAVRLSASFVTDDGRVAGLPASWETLAWITQEPLPPRRHRETYFTGENLLLGGTAVLTLGLSLLFTSFRPATIEVDPPLAEYERLAPMAARLHRAAERGGCVSHALSPSGGAGLRCSWYFVIDALSAAPLSLELVARYTSARTAARAESCAIERRARVPLGAPSTLEETARARFGDAMQRVDPTPAH